MDDRARADPRAAGGPQQAPVSQGCVLPQQSRHANDVTCVALSKDVFVWLIFPSDESTPLGSEHACVCDVQLVSAAAALGVGEQLGAAVCNAAADNAAASTPVHRSPPPCRRQPLGSVWQHEVGLWACTTGVAQATTPFQASQKCQQSLCSLTRSMPGGGGSGGS